MKDEIKIRIAKLKKQIEEATGETPVFGVHPESGRSCTPVLGSRPTMMKPLPAVVRIVLTIVISATVAASQAVPEALTSDAWSALYHISANSLRGHLSFIASDFLEGRDTPSRGLDLAAEYIAAQFRRAGLEPAGDDGYFQTANFSLSQFDTGNFQLTLQSGTKEVRLRADQVTLSFRQRLSTDGSIVKVSPENIAALTRSEVAGKVLMTEAPGTPDASTRAAFLVYAGQINALGARLVIEINRRNLTGTVEDARLVEPGGTGGNFDAFIAQNPSVTLHGSEAVAFFDALPYGLTAATVSLRAVEAERPVKLKNVIGILRGSDPFLRDTYVLVTAHYDHLGMRPSGDGDRIANGANDDGSGTVSVIEIASALATLQQKPKRSIVFMTVFGEEKGMLGSRYYSSHPVFPIDRTVANINLEQVGRTDSTEGPQVGTASLTGFDFSNIGRILQIAGESTGIRVYKHSTNSDSYFGRSDNQAFASLGIPAHTLCVAFNYPDYHRVTDHWEKVDYENMVNVDRMVALAVLMIATNSEEPRWDETNSRAAPYLKAWREHHR